MRVIHDMNAFSGAGSAVALGTFDGVHIGHAALIRETVSIAREKNLPALALAFDRHPLALICPEKAPTALISSEEKRALMEELGVDVLVEQPFTQAFADLSPQEFFRRLNAALRPDTLVAGFNYTFGKKGAGDARTLQAMCKSAGVSCRIMEPVCLMGGPVSSSRIRSMLKEGDTAGAEALLGRKIARI